MSNAMDWDMSGESSNLYFPGEQPLFNSYSDSGGLPIVSDNSLSEHAIDQSLVEDTLIINESSYLPNLTTEAELFGITDPANPMLIDINSIPDNDKHAISVTTNPGNDLFPFTAAQNQTIQNAQIDSILLDAPRPPTFGHAPLAITCQNCQHPVFDTSIQASNPLVESSAVSTFVAPFAGPSSRFQPTMPPYSLPMHTASAPVFVDPAEHSRLNIDLNCFENPAAPFNFSSILMVLPEMLSPYF
jgi:hypothetical protein